MKTYEFKVEQDHYHGWYAFDEKQGLDYDWNGDGWTSCGSPIGTGKNIQDALDSLIEQISEERAGKADPNNESFVYEINYTWK